MKLYISDLDGTLLNHDKEISPYTRDILNKLIDSGIHFTVATARSAASAVKILEGVRIRLPVILMNGVAVYDLAQKRYTKVEIIAPDLARRIDETLKRHEIHNFLYAISDHRLITFYENLSSKAMKEFYQERVLKFAKPFEQVPSFLDTMDQHEVIYFTVLGEKEKLEGAARELKELSGIDIAFYQDIYGDMHWYLEVFSQQASKYNAARYVKEQLGFETLIGFGDNLNDIPLFEACDEGYAVENAAALLKEKATGIIGSNMADGVAKFLMEREKTVISE